MSFSEADPAVARHVVRQIGREFLGEGRTAAAVREQIVSFLARHGTEHPPPPILLRGEHGVGKELLARAIHLLIYSGSSAERETPENLWFAPEQDERLLS